MDHDKTLYSDEIMIEVWHNRETYLVRHHYSLKQMVADLKQRQLRSCCVIVDRRTQRNIQGTTPPPASS